MDRDELLNELRDIETQLRASDVIQFVKQQAVSLRAQFAAIWRRSRPRSE